MEAEKERKLTANKAKILLVEDEADIRELISLHLTREGYRVDEAVDGEEGFEKAQRGPYDLLVLDWMLPKMSGLELIRSVRGGYDQRVPILMVTARVEAADLVLGLESGADDYITKPFEVPVLLARVRALLRRAHANNAATDKLIVGNLSIQMAAHEVLCDGQQVPLTRSEFDILVALVLNRGRVLTRDKLIDLVRGEDISIVSRAIDTHVFGLRKKLGTCADIIETIRGVGYRVKADVGQKDG